MNYKKKLTIALLLVSISPCNAAEKKPQRDIYVDWTVFIEPSKIDSLYQLGAWDSLKTFCSNGFDPKDSLKAFFDALSTVAPGQQPPTDIFWQGVKGPYLLYLSLTNKQTSHELLEQACKGIKKLNLFNQTAMLKIAEITFDPDLNAQNMKLNNEGLKLLRELQSNGHILHLIGNWNTEAFGRWQQKNPDALIIFKDITLSGEIGQVKGPDVYLEILRKSKNPEPIVIESQKEYFQQVQTLTGNTNPVPLLCNSGTYTSLRQELIKHGALPR